MNRDNISAVVMAIAVVSVIVGFAVYFNTQGSNIASKSNEFLSITTEQTTDDGKLINLDKSQFKQANDFTNIAQYINTKPISIDQLRDKVVLVDFWTYSCINCIRTIPHLNEWYDKYSDKGLVIIG
ncbi:MAG TPA: redoxin domain-containing protein, partial [Nitrososphaeraceae archaeon]|nr:redoxin domain-containing protein [Nitrososphaeraceae archaeon]